MTKLILNTTRGDVVVTRDKKGGLTFHIPRPLTERHLLKIKDLHRQELKEFKASGQVLDVHTQNTQEAVDPQSRHKVIDIGAFTLVLARESKGLFFISFYYTATYAPAMRWDRHPSLVKIRQRYFEFVNWGEYMALEYVNEEVLAGVTRLLTKNV